VAIMLTNLTINQKGMLLALGGYTAFAFADTSAKWIAPHYPGVQIAGLEGLIAATALLCFSSRLGGWRGAGNKREWGFHAIRAVLNIIINIILLYCFTFLSLADIYAMIFAKPFFAVILAILIYKEKVDAKRWAAIIIGFIGVLVVLQPNPATFQTALLLPLFVGFLVAILFMLSRSLKQASPFIMGFYPLMGTFILSLPLMAFDFKPIALEHLPFFILCGCLIAIGVLCVSLAFRLAQASLVAPFLYSEMIWGLLFGYLIFGDSPNFWMLAGSAIIIASGVYVIISDRKSPTV